MPGWALCPHESSFDGPSRRSASRRSPQQLAARGGRVGPHRHRCRRRAGRRRPRRSRSGRSTAAVIHRRSWSPVRAPVAGAIAETVDGWTATSTPDGAGFTVLEWSGGMLPVDETGAFPVEFVVPDTVGELLVFPAVQVLRGRQRARVDQRRPRRRVPGAAPADPGARFRAGGDDRRRPPRRTGPRSARRDRRRRQPDGTHHDRSGRAGRRLDTSGHRADRDRAVRHGTRELQTRRDRAGTDRSVGQRRDRPWRPTASTRSTNVGDDDDDGSSSAPWIIGGILLLAAIAVAAIVRGSSSRCDRTDAERSGRTSCQIM